MFPVLMAQELAKADTWLDTAERSAIPRVRSGASPGRLKRGTR